MARVRDGAPHRGHTAAARPLDGGVLSPRREGDCVTRLFPEQITTRDILLAVGALLATLAVAALVVFILGAAG